VAPWPDVVIDRVGIDPRSHYAEHFWLTLLGPSSLWLLRRITTQLEPASGEILLDTAELGRSLGLGTANGKNSAVMRTIARLCQFQLARAVDHSHLEVRRRLPPLTRTQVGRLSPSAQAEHEWWQRSQLRANHEGDLRRRARTLAISFVRLGDDFETTERQLHTWCIHPALAHDAATFAWSRRETIRNGNIAIDIDDPTAA
jgi:hypothetical protein